MSCARYVRTDLSVNAVTARGGKHGEMDETTANGMDPHVFAQVGFYERYTLISSFACEEEDFSENFTEVYLHILDIHLRR